MRHAHVWLLNKVLRQDILNNLFKLIDLDFFFNKQQFALNCENLNNI